MRDVRVLGVPYAAGCREETSFATDQQDGPAAMRKALSELMGGFNIPRAFTDDGDIQCDPGVDAVLDAVKSRIAPLLAAGAIPVLLGGSHTLTLGALRALHETGGGFSLIYVDAHPDMMPHPQVNWGSSLYYAFQEGLLTGKRTALIGVRQIEEEERKFIATHNVMAFQPTAIERVGIRSVLDSVFAKLPPPYYLSIDIDSIDPGFTPGVAAPYPGGLTPREVLYVAQEVAARETLGAEIVELTPASDRHDMSARVAAVLLHELTSALAKSPASSGGNGPIRTKV